VALLRHSHHHEGDGHHHAHGPDRHAAGKSGWMILIGDGMHNFTDGILIAAAFLANPELGIVTALKRLGITLPKGTNTLTASARNSSKRTIARATTRKRVK
jgi:zinc and cadmium transporter